MYPGNVAKQRVDYFIPWLPHFFLAEGQPLEQSVRTSLALCDVENTSQYMLVRDEVAFAKSWQVVCGLVPGKPDAPATVGGMHPGMALIPWEEKTEDEEKEAKPLKKEDLASVCVSTVIKRTSGKSMEIMFVSSLSNIFRNTDAH
jgi:hypothetical protein